MCREISNQNHRNTSKRTYLLDVLFLNNFLFSDYFDNEVEVKDTSVTAMYASYMIPQIQLGIDKIPQIQLGMLHTLVYT